MVIKSEKAIELSLYIGKVNIVAAINKQKGGRNMDKDQMKSFVAGLGIAGLVAGVSIAAPAGAAQSG